jgi:hypothetical protein
MTAAVGVIGAMVGSWSLRRDPYCGMVLSDNLQPIADAAVPLMCESEAVVRFFAGEDGDGTSWLKIIALAAACWPVASAFTEHHITRTVEIAERLNDDGGVDLVLIRKGEPLPVSRETPQQQPPAPVPGRVPNEAAAHVSFAQYTAA